MNSLLRKVRSSVALLTSIAIALSSVITPVAYAQSDAPDFKAPVIEHQAGTEGERGETQEFTALVTDDVGVASVLLFYRFTGDADYTELEMKSGSAANSYSASVPTKLDSSSPIEYYIQASDAAENSTLRGYSFSPLKRWLDPVGERGEADNADTTEPKKSKTLLYVLGGVLVLAVIGGAAASGGGGGGDGGTVNPPETQTLTLNLTKPGG